MVSQQKKQFAAQGSGADELGECEDSIIAKYAYLAMAVLILAAIVLMFLRFVLYLW